MRRRGLQTRSGLAPRDARAPASWLHGGIRPNSGLEKSNVKCPYRVIRVKCYLAITISLRNSNKLLTRAPILTLRSGSPHPGTDRTTRRAGPLCPMTRNRTRRRTHHVVLCCIDGWNRNFLGTRTFLSGYHREHHARTCKLGVNGFFGRHFFRAKFGFARNFSCQI